MTPLSIGSNEAGVLADDASMGTDVPEAQAEAQAPAYVFNADQVNTAKAACNEAHGPVDPVVTQADVQERVVGGWWLCSAANTFSTTASAVFGADGTWQRLLAVGGGLVLGEGVDSQSNYTIAYYDDASATCAANNCAVALSGGPGGLETEYGVAFETAPRRMVLGGGDWYTFIGAPPATGHDASTD